MTECVGYFPFAQPPIHSTPGSQESNAVGCITQAPLPSNSLLGLAVQGAGGYLPCSARHQHPDSDHICVPLYYSFHGTAPSVQFPWATITLFPPLYPSGLQRIIARITHADTVKSPKLQPGKNREK